MKLLLKYLLKDYNILMHFFIGGNYGKNRRKTC